MRRVVKGAPPAYLRINSERLTVAFLEDRTRRPYNHDEVKDALSAETHGKCAYCESPLSGSAYGAVEHIRPKRLFPELVVDWGNLTWACPVCNTNKGDYYSSSAPLLDPTRNDPSEVFEFHGPLISARLGNTVGEVSLTRLRLRRTQLMIDRSRAIEALDGLLQRWARESSHALKEVLGESILECIQCDKPFSAALLAFAQSREFNPEAATGGAGPLNE